VTEKTDFAAEKQGAIWRDKSGKIRLPMECDCDRLVLRYFIGNDGIRLKVIAMASSDKTKKAPMNFKSISQVDLPQGRNGKHKTIVTQLLSDLDQLRPGQALKIPLTELPDTKENVRSALNRATRIKRLDVATSSDADYFYVWVPEQKS
jgi:hypothetical protein